MKPHLRLSPKLRLASLWPALAAVLTATLSSAILMPRLLHESAGEQLQDSLDILAPLTAGHLTRPAAGDLQAWVARLAADSELRITVVDPTGTVLADSARDREQLARMDDHSDRPEVAEALTRGWGTAVRRSETTGLQYVYAARAVDLAAGRHVLRLAQPLRALEALGGNLAAVMSLAAVIALLVMTAISWWLDRRLFHPLTRLIAGARVISQGSYQHRLEVPEEDEVAQLALALNHLAQRVEDQIDRVRAERDHLSMILASMSEGVLVVDRRGRAELANPSFHELLDVDEPVAGKLPLEITRRVELARLVEQTLEEGRVGEAAIELQREPLRTLALTSVALDDPQGGAVVVVRDTSQATRLAGIRRDFVANVSHELRTPLSAIRAYAETLSEGALSEPATARRFVDRILEQCRRLTLLLEDLLTLSRLESAELPVRREPVDLHRAVQQAAETVAPRAAARGITVAVLPAADPLPPVSGDPGDLERMVVNLLDNGIKYSRPGGRVEACLDREPEWLLLEVADDGIGIPAEALPRIFERFYRVDKGRSREQGGTGLGLAIVKHVVASHDGRIEVSSEPEAGTRFRIRLPALGPAR